MESVNQKSAGGNKRSELSKVRKSDNGFLKWRAGWWIMVLLDDIGECVVLWELNCFERDDETCWRFCH